MSKKRKCRMTPEELAVHKEAVRLRGMTDRQLVELFHKEEKAEMASTASHVAQAASGREKPIKNTSDIEKLLCALSEGKCKGIKSATAYKVAQLAAEMGLL